MKKRFGFYITAWLLLLAIFNVIAFVSAGWKYYEKYTDSFWIGYVFITLAFIGQLVCSCVAFKADNAQKLFYNISLFRASYVGLFASFAVGGICMLASPLWFWIAILVCAAVLVLNIFAVAKASAAISEVAAIDEKVKNETAFVRTMTLNANTLASGAKSEAVKAECKKVYEAIRYSDPTNNEALASIQGDITAKFSEFSDAVKADDADKAAGIAAELIVLMGERNNMCKSLK